MYLAGRVLVFGFFAGALSVAIFHQGSVFLLFHHFGLLTIAPYSLRPLPPFGVPQVISQMFWGGVWGILLAMLLRRLLVPDLLFGLIFGAIACTAAGWYLVPWLKGQPMFSGLWVFDRMWRGLLLNGAWGFGAAFLMRPFSLRR